MTENTNATSEAIGILREALDDVAGLHREHSGIDEKARRMLLNAIDALRVIEAVTVRCDGARECPATNEQITHIDSKGYAYCARHGRAMGGGGRSCRKLTRTEQRRILAGKPIARY